MESVKIPDDFYIYEEENGCKWLYHKSCTLNNNTCSNHKFYYLGTKPVSNEIIVILRSICNKINEIEEKTYFVDHKFNDLLCGVNDSKITLYRENHYDRFANVNDFIDYLAENYPECVRSTDIKIALKD